MRDLKSHENGVLLLVGSLTSPANGALRRYFPPREDRTALCDPMCAFATSPSTVGLIFLLLSSDARGRVCDRGVRRSRKTLAASMVEVRLVEASPAGCA